MFKNDFVVAVKVDGKILREFENTVALPFGSEYTILLKNLSTKKAKVIVNIDGQSISGDSEIVVNPKQDVELKRFIKDMDKGNAFKFIEKTQDIENYRGNKAEDGLITIYYEFEVEQKITTYPYYPKPYYNDPWVSPTKWPRPHYDTIPRNVGDPPYDCEPLDTRIWYSSSTGTTLSANNLTTSSTNVNYGGNVLRSAVQNKDGITAPGSLVEQKFQTVASIITDGVQHTMTLKLVGKTKEDEPIKQAVSVKQLVRCCMCGKRVRHTDKFCSNCGASVQII